jgi:hypothetical protein
MSSSATGVKKVVEAAGVELGRFSETGLIRRIPAKLDPLKPPDPLKCSRAGTKQVQQIARRATRRLRPQQRDSSPSAIGGTIRVGADA